LCCEFVFVFCFLFSISSWIFFHLKAYRALV
jgi:hypothetical protein